MLRNKMSERIVSGLCNFWAITNGTSRGQISFLQLILLTFFCLIVLRLWYFQIYKGDIYSKRAKENRLQQQHIYAPRGLIFDRNGYVLAENKPAYGLAIIREDCRNIEHTLSQVSQWTDIPLNKLWEKYKYDKKNIPAFKRQLLVANVPFQKLARIEPHLMEWPELQIVAHPLRHYPHGELLSHLIGYVGEANEKELHENKVLLLGDKIGKQGLELVYEKTLRGQKGKKQIEVNAQGRNLNTSILAKPHPGENIYLTIDLDLQQFIWDQLGNKTAAVIVMSPNNGDILSLVSKPGYNNNLFVQGIDSQQWITLLSDKKHPLQNRAVQCAYPPGSVFKLVMAACVLYHDDFPSSKKIYCPGFYRLGNRRFHCWKKRGHGWMNLRTALKESCDVYFYNLGEYMGVDCISSFAQEYGFNQKTGIDLPNESKGLIPDREWKYQRFGEKWQGGETINMSIGQGYTLMTPLQVARFTAALINGGKLLKPQMLLAMTKTIQKKLPLSPQKINFIVQAMIDTVEEPHGTAWRLRTPEVTIGGKTGTAQVIQLTQETQEKELDDIPYKYRDHAWMTSFGWKDEKRYVVVAFVEHGGHGSSGAGPIVKKIYDYLF